MAHHLGRPFQTSICCWVLGYAKEKQPDEAAAGERKQMKRRSTLRHAEMPTSPAGLKRNVAVHRRRCPSPLTVSREQLRPSVRMMNTSALRGQVFGLQSAFKQIHDSYSAWISMHCATVRGDACRPLPAHFIGRKSPSSNEPFWLPLTLSCVSYSASKASSDGTAPSLCCARTRHPRAGPRSCRMRCFAGAGACKPSPLHSSRLACSRNVAMFGRPEAFPLPLAAHHFQPFAGSISVSLRCLR